MRAVSFLYLDLQKEFRMWLTRSQILRTENSIDLKTRPLRLKCLNKSWWLDKIGHWYCCLIACDIYCRRRNMIVK